MAVIETFDNINIHPEDLDVLSNNLGVLTFTWEHGVISTSSGYESNTTTYIRTKNLSEVISGHTYHIEKHTMLIGTCFLNEYSESGTWLRSKNFGSGTSPFIYEPPSDTKYIKFTMKDTSSSDPVPLSLGSGLFVVDVDSIGHQFGSLYAYVNTANATKYGISSVKDLPYNSAALFASDVTSSTVSDLPVYGEYTTVFKIQPTRDGQFGTGYSGYIAFGKQVTSTDMLFVYVGKESSNGFVTWTRISPSITYIETTTSIVSSRFPSMGDFPPGFSWVLPSWFTDSSLPFTDACWLFAYSPSQSSTVKMQIAFNPSTGLVYWRNRSNQLVWTSWTLMNGSSGGGIDGTQWMGKSWYAYGTSMTEYVNRTLPGGNVIRGYAAFLPTMSGLSLTNRGKGGSGIVPSLHGGLSGDNVYTRVMASDGKDTADLITLEILPNDDSAAIGDIDDVWDGVEGSSSETFLGCLANLLKHLQQNTTAQIVVLITTTSVYARDEQETPYTPEGNKIAYLERIEAVKRKCSLYGVPVFDGFGEGGLGLYRLQDGHRYVADHIHLAAPGGYNLAKFFWSKLKDIPNFYTDAE